MNQFIQSWLLQSLAIFLIIGSLAGVVVGVLLVLRPQSLQRLNQRLNRWFSTRHLERPLERSVTIDPWFYRYRRTGGTLILLGALYILYFFTASLDRSDVTGRLATYFDLPAPLVGALLDAMVLSALLGALFAAFVSLFLLVRPSMLRGFEQGANQWLSLRRGMKPMEIERGGMDEYILQHRQGAGILIVLASLYAMVLLAVWLGNFHGA